MMLLFVVAEIDRQVQEIQAKRRKLNETTTQQEKVKIFLFCYIVKFLSDQIKFDQREILLHV